MKKILMVIATLGTLIIAGQTHGGAQAGTCTPNLRCATHVSPSRSFERRMMLKRCVQIDARHWACPDPAPKSFMTIVSGNEGGGSGGYSQLPTCGPAYYGVTLYVQGHYWRCIHSTPDHWVLS